MMYIDVLLLLAIYYQSLLFDVTQSILLRVLCRACVATYDNDTLNDNDNDNKATKSTFSSKTVFRKLRVCASGPLKLKRRPT